MRSTLPLARQGERDGGPMMGIVNGVAASLAIWMVIAAVILAVS